MPTNVVVMFCGPFYGAKPFHYGRIDRAIQEAKHLQAPLVVCGDGTKGKELTAFHARAIKAGVVEVHTSYNSKANTLGDAISAARTLMRRYPDVKRVLLVTDWYHMLRARTQLQKKLRATPNKHLAHVRIMHVCIWDHFTYGLKTLPRELRGVWHALINRPQQQKRPVRVRNPSDMRRLARRMMS